MNIVSCIQNLEVLFGREIADDPAMAAGHSNWTFLSNHAHVLICLAENPEARLRDLAERVGITERAVQAIVTDLEHSGALTRIREGRRNRYELHDDVRLRHPVESHCTIKDLLAMAGFEVKSTRRRKNTKARRATRT